MLYTNIQCVVVFVRVCMNKIESVSYVCRLYTSARLPIKSRLRLDLDSL